MIRILLDRAFDNERHYIHAVGLSTDTKPTTGIITGSRFVAVDTGAAFLFDEAAGTWTENQQMTAAVRAWLDAHPGVIDQATIVALIGHSLDEVEPLSRVTSLDNTALAPGNAIEAVGIPVYVQDVSQYAAYGITATGWYVFARIAAPAGEEVTAGTTINGAAGHIATVGGDHIDLAVRFDTTAQSVPVTIAWGNVTDRFVFKASDLAARNLDYRVTFYIYDISPYAVWSYALTADTTFQENKSYYTKDENDVYTLAEVTAGDPVPENTYYNHAKLRFEGMVANVTYMLPDVVDCPIEIALPEIADDGHGAWFEIQMRYDASRSCTLLPPEGVKIGTAQTQAQTAGINTIDLQYTVAGDVKMWTLLNTHSNIPTT